MANVGDTETSTSEISFNVVGNVWRKSEACEECESVAYFVATLQRSGEECEAE